MHAIARYMRRYPLVALTALFLSSCGSSGPSIEGRLVDIASGNPISDLPLVATTSTDIKEDIERARVTAETDGEGHFKLRGLLPSRRYTLSANDPRCTIRELTVESPEAGQTRFLKDLITGFCPAATDLASIIQVPAIEIRLCSEAPVEPTERLVRTAVQREPLVARTLGGEPCHLFLLPIANNESFEPEAVTEKLRSAGGVDVQMVSMVRITAAENLPSPAVLSTYGCENASSLLALFNAVGGAVLPKDDQRLSIILSARDDDSRLSVISAHRIRHDISPSPKGCWMEEEMSLGPARTAAD